MAMAAEIVVTGSRIARAGSCGQFPGDEGPGGAAWRPQALPRARTGDRVGQGAQAGGVPRRGRRRGRLLYKAGCSPSAGDGPSRPRPGMLLATVNDKKHGLGAALPMGGITVFAPSAHGDQLVAEDRLRDYAEGQDVEIDLGDSSQVFVECTARRRRRFRRQPAALDADARRPDQCQCGAGHAAACARIFGRVAAARDQGQPGSRTAR